MIRPSPIRRLAVSSALSVALLASCTAPFRVGVEDYRGRERAKYYQDEALYMRVNWHAVRDGNGEVGCRIVNTYTGTTEWLGHAVLPGAVVGEIARVDFEPGLPPNGQFELRPGTYNWVCDLANGARSFATFIVGR